MLFFQEGCLKNNGFFVSLLQHYLLAFLLYSNVLELIKRLFFIYLNFFPDIYFAVQSERVLCTAINANWNMSVEYIDQLPINLECQAPILAEKIKISLTDTFLNLIPLFKILDPPLKNIKPTQNSNCLLEK